ELGYSLAHAFGAAFDNPDLLVACVVGDGEAETGPLATSWHSNKFLNPRTDGAVLPILHLNGYKIANPTLLARIPESELVSLFEGYGYRPLVVAGGVGGEPAAVVHQRFAAALADAHPAHPERLDGTGRGRRPARRRHLAFPSGTDRRRAREPGAPPPARRVAAELPAGGAVRRAWRARLRAARARPVRRAADEREPARERRRPPPGARPARLP